MAGADGLVRKGRVEFQPGRRVVVWWARPDPGAWRPAQNPEPLSAMARPGARRPWLPMRPWQMAALFVVMLAQPALAGPPYVSDDPEPTDYKHFEIYTFNNGTNTRDGTAGESGIDFNYGAAPDLQLTATLPEGYSQTIDGTSIGASNIELAAKYRFLHQDGFGLDVSVFPRVFLPSGSNVIGDNHASLLLPVW